MMRALYTMVTAYTLACMCSCTYLPYSRSCSPPHRCCLAQVPLSSPAYLIAFHLEVVEIQEGRAEGGNVFTVALVLADAEPREPIPAALASPLPAPLASPLPGPAAAIDGTIKQLLTMITEQNRSSDEKFLRILERSSPAAPARQKDLWAKLMKEVKDAIAGGLDPSWRQLSSDNHLRLDLLRTQAQDKKSVKIGGSISLELEPDAISVSAKAHEHKICEVFTGLSAYNRLLSIMVNASEDVFSRKALSEVITVWREIWDSRRGTPIGKLDAFTAFYRMHADTLGDGLWENKLNSDSRFLHDYLDGAAHADCSFGMGTHSAACQASKHRQAPKHQGAPTKRGRDQTKNGRSAPTRSMDMKGSYCSSMLIQSKTCKGNCSRKHSPCPSCGGSCTAASACTSWDNALVVSKHGDAIDRITRSAGRKRGRH